MERNSKLDPTEIYIAKGLVYSIFKQENISNFPKRFYNAIINLKKNENLHITRADKSKTFVILDKENYINKVNDLLSDIET